MVKKAGGLFRVFLMVLVATLAVSLAGCQFIKIEEGERTPLEYTIVKQEEIPAEELVLDDIVLFRSGDQICADAVVLEGSDNVAGLTLADIVPLVDRICAVTTAEKADQLRAAVEALSPETEFVPELTALDPAWEGSCLILE